MNKKIVATISTMLSIGVAFFMLAKDFLAEQVTFEGIICALIGFGLVGVSVGLMAIQIQIEIKNMTEEEYVEFPLEKEEKAT